MRTFVRAAACAVLLSLCSIGVDSQAHAQVDNEHSLVDSQGRTLVVQQSDTFLNGVMPLDRNRLTREWFHTGSVGYTVAGPDAEAFEGTLEIGYQVSFPWSMGVGLTFQYSTPNLATYGWGSALAYSPPFVPGATISVNLGNGPGLQDVAVTSGTVSGSEGQLAVSNAHGTITGAAGGVLIRPYARLITAEGESVTTYGEPWNMN